MTTQSQLYLYTCPSLTELVHNMGDVNGQRDQFDNAAGVFLRLYNAQAMEDAAHSLLRLNMGAVKKLVIAKWGACPDIEAYDNEMPAADVFVDGEDSAQMCIASALEVFLVLHDFLDHSFMYSEIAL